MTESRSMTSGTEDRLSTGGVRPYSSLFQLLHLINFELRK